MHFTRLRSIQNQNNFTVFTQLKFSALKLAQQTSQILLPVIRKIATDIKLNSIIIFNQHMKLEFKNYYVKIYEIGLFESNCKIDSWLKSVEIFFCLILWLDFGTVCYAKFYYITDRRLIFTLNLRQNVKGVKSKTSIHSKNDVSHRWPQSKYVRSRT